MEQTEREGGGKEGGRDILRQISERKSLSISALPSVHDQWYPQPVHLVWVVGNQKRKQATDTLVQTHHLERKKKQEKILV